MSDPRATQSQPSSPSASARVPSSEWRTTGRRSGFRPVEQASRRPPAAGSARATPPGRCRRAAVPLVPLVRRGGGRHGLAGRGGTIPLLVGRKAPVSPTGGSDRPRPRGALSRSLSSSATAVFSRDGPAGWCRCGQPPSRASSSSTSHRVGEPVQGDRQRHAHPRVHVASSNPSASAYSARAAREQQPARQQFDRRITRPSAPKSITA